MDEADAVLAEVGQENPAIAYVTQRGPVPVLKITDLVTVRQLKETGFHREASRFVTFDDQAAIFGAAGGHIFGFASFRDRVFTEDEMALMELFQPHMQVALEQAHRFRSLPADHGLTLREEEVLAWVVEGKTDGEVSVILKISLRTVNNHVLKILDKLRVENRSSAVALVWRWRAGGSL